MGLYHTIHPHFYSCYIRYMEYADGRKLITHAALTNAVATQWADLGCGAGFFTNVLSSFLAKGSSIHAVDTDASSLKKVRVADGIALTTHKLDVVKQPWPFNSLDGILMANALHYVRDKDAFIQKLQQHLATGGLWLLVEYDTDSANPWVPFPVSFSKLQKLCSNHALSVEKINSMPSAFGRSTLYSAIIKV